MCVRAWMCMLLLEPVANLISMCKHSMCKQENSLHITLEQ